MKELKLLKFWTAFIYKKNILECIKMYKKKSSVKKPVKRVVKKKPVVKRKKAVVKRKMKGCSCGCR